MPIRHGEGFGNGQQEPVNKPFTDPFTSFQPLQVWSKARFPERDVSWGIGKYAGLLDLPPSIFTGSRPGQTWDKFLDIEAKGDKDLISLFPKPEDRGRLIRNAKDSLEWIKRRCFDWDYVLQSPQITSTYSSSQAYWEDRDAIIANEYQQTQRSLYRPQDMNLDAFTNAYWSKLCYDFMSGHVMPYYLTLHDLQDLRNKYPQGYHGYLKQYEGQFQKDYVSPRGKEATDEMVVHVLSRKSLDLALTTERLGNYGIGRAVFSEDRVCYDDGYALVFSLKELQAVYPMYQFDEDPLDAHILQEWRSPIAVDMNLALACIPTTEKYFGTIPGFQPGGVKLYGLDVIQAIKQRYNT